MWVFQERQFTSHHYLTSLMGWLRMVLVIVKSYIGYATSDLSTLRGLIGVQGRSRRASLFIQIHWLPPHIGWVKLNTNGIAQDVLSRAAAGGVFIDHMGLLSVHIVLMLGLGLVRPSLRSFRLLFRVLSIFISVVGAGSGLSSIRWRFFSACSPLLISLIDMLSQGGITASSSSLAYVSIAFASTERVKL